MPWWFYAFGMLDRRLLFLGDSFVVGVGDPEGRGWVGRVLAQGGDGNVTAYNLGVRGETSVQVAERWWDEAEPRLVAGADCRLVVSVGANDCAEADGGGPRVDPRDSLQALESILEAAEQSGLGVFVVGPPPIGTRVEDERVLELDRRFSVHCRERDLPFVSVAETLRSDPAWTAEARRDDGTHPGAGGYAALADLVLAGGWLRWLAG
jgi:acyl-CoA thioesterase I